MQNEEREIMNRWNCHDDRLVEYADGLLSRDEQAAAEEHLRGCAACQRELIALQQSLLLVRQHWDRPLSELVPALSTVVQLPERRAGSQRRPVTGMLMRAALVAAVVVTLAWQLSAHRNPIAPRQPTVAVVTPEITPPNTENTPDTDNIELWLQQQTQAARLRAASALLADEPGMAERSEQLARYATEAYGP
jgi:anti-sigma factor RsiW